jgi:hypothetical protein
MCEGGAGGRGREFNEALYLIRGGHESQGGKAAEGSERKMGCGGKKMGCGEKKKKRRALALLAMDVQSGGARKVGGRRACVWAGGGRRAGREEERGMRTGGRSMSA